MSNEFSEVKPEIKIVYRPYPSQIRAAKRYYLKNKEKLLLKQKKRDANRSLKPGYKLQRKTWNKNYYERKKEQLKEYQKRIYHEKKLKLQTQTPAEKISEVEEAKTI